MTTRYMKVRAAREKKAAAKDAKPVQQLAIGGMVQKLGVGGYAGQAGAQISDGWKGMAGNHSDPLQPGFLTPGGVESWMNGANNFHVDPVSGNTNVANPFDMGNPTVQAMHQQGVAAPNFAGANAAQIDQSHLVNMLQQQAAGQGPGQELARQMMQQQTQQNIQQGAGLMASAKGVNPALAAKMAADQAGTMNQQAAAQGTQFGLQQQLAAQGQLGNVLSGMRQQGIEQGMGTAQVALGNQGQQLGALGQFNTNVLQGNLGADEINAKVSMGNQAAANQVKGGLINAFGSILSSAAGSGGKMAEGVAGGAMAAAHGAMVPGRPKVAGDSERNDTVDAKLSPGEIVIPRSIAQHPHAPWLAAAFVHQVINGRGPAPHYEGGKEKAARGGKVRGYDEGGEVTPGDKADLSAASSGPSDSSILDWILGGNGPGAPASQSLLGAGASTVAKLPMAASQAMAEAPGNGTWQRSMRGDGNLGSMDGAQALAPDQVPMAGAAPAVNLNTQGLPSSPAAAGSNPFLGGMDAYQKAFGQEEAGIRGAAGAAQRESDQVGEAYKDNQLQQIAARKQYQTNLQNLDQENQRLTQAVMNGEIDPNRFWANTSTAGKVMAAIGVALSGIGSGLSGQPNMAMGVINKMIDQDIEAQKADLGKKQTLLSMNLQKYGRLDAAQAATQAQMHSALQGQIGLAAAQAGGAKAAANAQMLLGELGMKKAGLQQQTALYGAFTGASSGGPASIGDRLRYGIQGGIIPKDLTGTAIKEYGDYTKLGNSLGSVDQAFQRVGSLQTLGERLGSPVQSKTQIEAVKKIFSAQLAKDLEGRATPQDIDSIMANFPELTDSPDTVKQKRLDLHNSIKSKYAFPTLNAYGLVDRNDPLIRPHAALPGSQTIQRGN